MKVAIPLEGDKISFHFGRCLQFAFFEIENNKVLNKEIVDAPSHQEGAFPQFLKDKGAELVIVSRIGRKALEVLSQLNIKVIQGIEGEIEEIIKKFLEEKLNGEKKSM
ncbi:MAG: hypothetical protein B6D55_06850 [Candidatus Omnitrophica bacterium 4484_70.2]|nr:MAG: hypothetical protein B6D55_06850 [Candidatus Omnitrophica bacterium 4484_70.2]